MAHRCKKGCTCSRHVKSDAHREALSASMTTVIAEGKANRQKTGEHAFKLSEAAKGNKHRLGTTHKLTDWQLMVRRCQTLTQEQGPNGSKLTRHQAWFIKFTLLPQNVSYKKIAKQFGLKSTNSVKNIATGQTWGWLTEDAYNGDE